MDAPVMSSNTNPLNAKSAFKSLNSIQFPTNNRGSKLSDRRVMKTYIRPQYVGGFSTPDGP